MASMSYCRFENVANDMSDCVEAMKRFNKPEDGSECEIDDDGNEIANDNGGPTQLEALSDYERQGLRSALAYAAEMLELASPELLAEAGVDLKRIAA